MFHHAYMILVVFTASFSPHPALYDNWERIMGSNQGIGDYMTSKIRDEDLTLDNPSIGNAYYTREIGNVNCVGE